MNRPSLYDIDIWAQWESGILIILTEALSQLSNHVKTDYTENDITTEFFKIIRDIKFNNPQIAFGSIIPQAQNPPLNPLGEEENKISLRKRPDLQWIFNDEHASTPEKSQRYYTIECKCLSTSTEEKHYVEEGIKRFVLDEWGYGRNEKSAVMIGYMKDEDADRHLCQINKHNEKHIYPLLFMCANENEDVYRCIQRFETREFEPQNFNLHHLWVNISKQEDI